MEKRSYSLQITGSELGEGTFLEQKTIFGQGLFRDLLSKVTKPTAASARSGLLTEAQRGRNQLWSLQPVPMTQRYPDVTSRRGCFAVGFAYAEYNRREDGSLCLPRHERRQQLWMPPSGLLHIHHLLGSIP